MGKENLQRGNLNQAVLRHSPFQIVQLQRVVLVNVLLDSYDDLQPEIIVHSQERTMSITSTHHTAWMRRSIMLEGLAVDCL